MSFDFVPRRPSAAFSSRLWRLCAVTPRLTRAIPSSPLCLQVREHASDLLLAGLGHDRLARVAPRAARRLDIEVVAAPRLDADELATAGRAEALRGSLVAFYLRHLFTL